MPDSNTTLIEKGEELKNKISVYQKVGVALIGILWPCVVGFYMATSKADILSDVNKIYASKVEFAAAKENITRNSLDIEIIRNNANNQNITITEIKSELRNLTLLVREVRDDVKILSKNNPAR